MRKARRDAAQPGRGAVGRGWALALSPQINGSRREGQASKPRPLQWTPRESQALGSVHWPCRSVSLQGSYMCLGSVWTPGARRQRGIHHPEEWIFSAQSGHLSLFKGKTQAFFSFSRGEPCDSGISVASQACRPQLQPQEGLAVPPGPWTFPSGQGTWGWVNGHISKRNGVWEVLLQSPGMFC